MPQSLSAVCIHLVFSTKDRRPRLRDKPTRDALHSYLGGVSKQLDCAPIQIVGVEDHVHALARFGRTITQAEWVKELKRVSNLWLKERGRDYADLEWQGGYADFSVSQSNLEQVKAATVLVAPDNPAGCDFLSTDCRASPSRLQRSRRARSRARRAGLYRVPPSNRPRAKPGIPSAAPTAPAGLPPWSGPHSARVFLGVTCPAPT
jgi:REP element-mobilizing transposase RayT